MADAHVLHSMSPDPAEVSGHVAYSSLIGICPVVGQCISVLHILGAAAHVHSQLVLCTLLVKAHDTVQI